MSQTEKLKEMLDDFREQKFYGEVVIKIENGIIVICKVTRSVKI